MLCSYDIKSTTVVEAASISKSLESQIEFILRYRSTCKLFICPHCLACMLDICPGPWHRESYHLLQQVRQEINIFFFRITKLSCLEIGDKEVTGQSITRIKQVVINIAKLPFSDLDSCPFLPIDCFLLMYCLW